MAHGLYWVYSGQRNTRIDTMSENVIEQYLTDVAEIHATRANAPESSFSPALEKIMAH
jgi:hypothetical protein